MGVLAALAIRKITHTVNTQLVINQNIVGPSLVCNGETVDFYLPNWSNNPADCYFTGNVEWVLPSGWTLISSWRDYGLNRFYYRIKAATSGSGSSILKVRGTGHAAGNTPYKTKTILVGAPQSQYISLAVFQGSSGQYDLCEDALNLVGATYSEGSAREVVGFNWTVSNSSTIAGYQDNITSPGYDDQGIEIDTYGIYSNLTISASAYNTCSSLNTSAALSKTFYLISCGYYLMSISPNLRKMKLKLLW